MFLDNGASIMTRTPTTRPARRDRTRSKRLVVFAFGALAFCMNGCVPNRAYRTGDLTFSGKQLPQSELDVTVAPRASMPALEGNQPRNSPFDLAFIEFDDAGEMWTIGKLNGGAGEDNSQLIKTVDLIATRKKEFDGRVTVVTFIHGWRNNASSRDEVASDKSLAGFKATLQVAANRIPSRRFVGVFIGWRGQVIPGGPLVTYWNRRGAADRVAGTSLTESLFALMFATRGGYAMGDPCGVAGTEAENDSHFVVIGHSFGGRILERAVAQPYMALFQERMAQQRQNCPERDNSATHDARAFSSPADLIVFLNPANGSLEGKAMIEGMLRMNMSASRNEAGAPLFLSITSAGDSATSKAMPAAQAVTARQYAFRKDYGIKAAELGEITQHPQRYYFEHSEGNVPEFLTHSITEVTQIDSCAGCLVFLSSAKRYVMKPIESPWNTTPFWVVRAPSSLIKDHNDIFGPGVVNLLAAVIFQYGNGQTNIRVADSAP